MPIFHLYEQPPKVTRTVLSMAVDGVLEWLHFYSRGSDSVDFVTAWGHHAPNQTAPISNLFLKSLNNRFDNVACFNKRNTKNHWKSGRNRLIWTISCSDASSACKITGIRVPTKYPVWPCRPKLRERRGIGPRWFESFHLSKFWRLPSVPWVRAVTSRLCDHGLESKHLKEPQRSSAFISLKTTIHR